MIGGGPAVARDRSDDPGCKPADRLGRPYSVLSHAVVCEGVARVSHPSTESWGADAALDQLYAAHWRSLVRLSAFLVGDLGTAEEVTQDAFVAMHRRWNRLRSPDRALAYLRQAVVNRSRSVLRHRVVVQRQARRDAARPPEHAADPVQQVVAEARRDQVLAALAGLPQRQREVIALRFYAELSEAEIADTLGISRGAVKSHAARGAAHLRQTLAPLLEEPR